MKRITITLYPEVYEKLEARAKTKGIPSTSQCIRELVELGLRIEEASANPQPNEDEIDLLGAIAELKKLLIPNLNWSLETRLLARFIVENQTVKGDEKIADVLAQYKDKAQSHVNGLLGYDIN